MKKHSLIKQLRHLIYNVLQNESYESSFSRFVDFFLIFLIIANVIAVIARSVDTIHYPYQEYFTFFEDFSIVIFSIEYLLRLWCVIEAQPNENTLKQRWKWMRSPSAIIDLIAILPAIIIFFGTVDLRIIRILRLFRLLKLTRYFSSLKILLIVLKREKGSFQAVLFILSILLVTASTGIYLAENNAQPEVFASIPHSMWWAVVTLTTVGYGDVTPITLGGKIFGAIITILGVGFAALPAGILASGLASELNQRREELEQTFREMLMEEGIEIMHNQIKVDKLRQELGLPKDVAQKIELQVLREINLAKREKAIAKKNFCPNCGNSLD